MTVNSLIIHKNRNSSLQHYTMSSNTLSIPLSTTHVCLTYAGHTFRIPRIPTESTEVAHRRAWWIVCEWERQPTSSFDTLWNHSIAWSAKHERRVTSTTD
jgi:hypothetical protein